MCSKYNPILASKGAEMLMRGLGIEIGVDTKETPHRMANAYRDICEGLYVDYEELKHLAKVFPSSYGGMILQSPIEIYSMCAHHLFQMKLLVSFAYIPTKDVIGFGKIPSILKLIGAKPHSQESFTEEVIDVFDKLIKPKGLAVVVRGWHNCIVTRKHCNFSSITSKFTGEFLKPENKMEFYTQLKFAQPTLL